MAVVKKNITTVKVNSLFSNISIDEYNIDPAQFAHELAKLTVKWKNDGYVEVYSHPSRSRLGQVKSSEENKEGHFIYQYCDVFHGRIVEGKVDPLVIVKFTPDPDDESKEYLSLRFLANHDQLFGSRHEKHNKPLLTSLRNAADENLKDGDNEDPQ